MPDAESVQLALTNLDLEMALDYDSGSLRGSAMLSLRNLGSTPTGMIPLQLGRLMTVHEVRSREGRQLPFSQNVVIYRDEPKLQVNQLYVDLISPLPHGDTVSVHVEYSGVLVGYTEVGWRYVKDHIAPDFTILREDAFAFPHLGLPSMVSYKAVPRMNFSFSARITAPSDLTVATGTPEKERIKTEGVTTWLFEGHSPVPFLNIAIAPYQTMSDREVNIFHFSADQSGARRLLDAVHRALDLYSEWFGSLPERPKFHIIEVPEGWGSQASLSAGIVLTADSFQQRKDFVGLYHELAHLWHPHDLERPSPRWNEGLVSFLQHRVAQDLDGAECIAIRMSKIWDSLKGQLKRDPNLKTVAMIDYGRHYLTDYSYTVGRLMFYALFEVMGRQEFDQVMGEYFQTYRECGTTTDQLVDFFRTHSKTNHQRVFEDWLFTTNWTNQLSSGMNLCQVMKTYL